MLPHLGAAFNLAVWLLRNPQDAEDAVQDAFVKAYKAYHQFKGEYPAAWLLKIVRNTCLTFLKRNADRNKVVNLDSVINIADTHRAAPDLYDMQPLPDDGLIAKSERKLVREAISQLPPDYREVVVLREFEEMTYQQIADVTEVPIGTVMSRLARARKKLRDQLSSGQHSPDKNGGRQNEL